jgi:hypothetical protein
MWRKSTAFRQPSLTTLCWAKATGMNPFGIPKLRLG